MVHLEEFIELEDVWPILLQCKLVGKAQEVVSSLSFEESMNYDTIKETLCILICA